MKEQDREYLNLLSVTFGHKFLFARKRKWDRISSEKYLRNFFGNQFILFNFFLYEYRED